MRTERLLGIISVLADTRRTTIGALAQRFEVSKRTIARDLEVLERAGVPLVTFPGAKGGVGVLESFKVRRDLLTAGDASALRAGLEALLSVDGDRIVAQLIARLVPSSDEAGANTDEVSTDSPLAIDLSPWFADSIVKEKLTCLLEAARERRCVQLAYVSRTGRSTRVVEPTKLLFRQTSWYLHAYCRTREEFRLFKLQRIATINVLDESFDPCAVPPCAPKSFDTPLLLPAENETPDTLLIELDYDAVNEFALAGALDARFLYRDDDADAGVVRFRTDDESWARRMTKNLGNLVRVREP